MAGSGRGEGVVVEEPGSWGLVWGVFSIIVGFACGEGRGEGTVAADDFCVNFCETIHHRC